MRMQRATAVAVFTAGCLALVGCAPADADPDGPASAAPEPPTTDDGAEITVLAAASLTDAFTAIAEQVERDNPGSSVVLGFAASSELVAQVVAGAPADVLATASAATMATVVDAGLAEDPVVFATNRLQIAVPPNDPGDVDELADLAAGARPDRVVALCAPEVPCGAAAERVFAAAGLTPGADTLEQDVRGVLSRVALGEVDAGVVYRSDVVAAGGDVVGVDVPEADAAVTEDPVVVLADAPEPELAAAFVAEVTGERGQQVLARLGFGAP